ncbi:unnamed protein product [Prorocentrum cordatum]|uniref:Uncharacterized protein n=1 Tax=Prorocentrum cordatum TaxID=2364126 RepID=A0ABN9WB55_9DINO|nr:unnamed protein product [Polarella glacialis]
MARKEGTHLGSGTPWATFKPFNGSIPHGVRVRKWDRRIAPRRWHAEDRAPNRAASSIRRDLPSPPLWPHLGGLNSNGPLAGALSVQPHRPGFHHASWASDAVAAGAPRRLCAAGLPGNCARQPSGGGVMAARRALGSGPPRNGSLHRPRLAARSCVSWGRARSLWPRSPRATGGPRSGSARGGKPSARKICAPRGNAHEPFAC